MRFLADIPIGRATIEFLRSKGHDAVSVRDLLPATAPDVDIVQAAARDGRIVLCFDLDFSALVSQSGKTVPSVIR